MNDFEIFGMNGAPKRRRKGCHITFNVKNRNAYLSREGRDLIFGENAKKGRCLIIHSRIERKWYIAKADENLFKTGFECVQNNPKEDDSVWRINGAANTFGKFINEKNENSMMESERFVFDISEEPILFNNMELHQMTIKRD